MPKSITRPPQPVRPAHYRQIAYAAAVLLALLLIGRETIPFEIRIPGDFLREQAVDPQLPLRISGVGIGTRISEILLTDDEGAIIFESRTPSDLEGQNLLRFGKSYRLKVTADRPWLKQTLTREYRFRTAQLPRIESPLSQQLSAEGNLVLRFSDPVGELSTESDIPFEIHRSDDGKGFLLSVKAGRFEQGHHYPVGIQWSSPEGVPLPTFEIDVGTAPPLSAVIDIEGMKNLGLGLPAEITFSEPVLNREKAASSVRITTESGETVPVRWLWYGKQRLQYRPETFWPPNQTLKVTIEPGPAQSMRGGFLQGPITGSFTTGSDRRIEVWLDRQRVEVFENGELIKTLKASTGKSKTPTVTGSFYIYARFPKKTMKSTGLKPGEKGYYEVKDVPYAQYFHEGYAFHGAFWHNAFGQPASHGCINLATQEKNTRQGINEDAGWLYRWASLGVPVTVHETSPPKPPAPSERITP